MNYTWNITEIKSTLKSDPERLEIEAYWSKTGTDVNGNTGVFNDMTPFTLLGSRQPDVEIPLLLPSEEIILEWVKAAIVGYESYVDEQIQDQIDQQNSVE